ncbi:MAG: sulfite exporter TauE/SafE family protein [Chitinophagaceae bacterium]|nr:sulfite exporter TauE/SafE family protein [Chitinophagaceae bacterium]
MEVFGYIAAILIGISLGLVGSGGSILTVPVLVYLMHAEPLIATTSSLFIVGTTSLVGGLRAHSKSLVDFKAVTEFGFPSVFSIFITRHYILPEIPDTINISGSFSVSKSMLLMVVFAVLMLLASYSMIANKEDERNDWLPRPGHERIFPLMFFGLTIGVITGLLGAGGGFLIIPTLVIFLGLDMKKAVGTSLLIIAINSLFGFLFSLKQFTFNWQLLLSFTVLAVAGIFIGGKLSERIKPVTLKKSFGWFVLVMGVYIIIKELFFTA